jgi:hypothetical protein
MMSMSLHKWACRFLRDENRNSSSNNASKAQTCYREAGIVS